MEYIIGIVIGIVIALVIGAVAPYFFLSDKQPVVVPPLSTASDSAIPAMTTFLTVSFLNQQLQKIFLPGSSGASGDTAPASQKLGPVKIRMNGADIQLLPERTARLTAHLTATAIGINIGLAPVTEFTFLPEAGRARIFVNKISLEGINIPRHWVEGFIESYISEAETKLNQILGQLEQETNITLTAIETSPDLLTLKFT